MNPTKTARSGVIATPDVSIDVTDEKSPHTANAFISFVHTEYTELHKTNLSWSRIV